MIIRLYYLRYSLLGVKMDEVHVLVVACMERAVLEMTGMKMNVGILMNSKLMEVVGLFQKTLAMIEDIQYTVAI